MEATMTPTRLKGDPQSEALRLASARRYFRKSPQLIRALRRNAGLALVDVAVALGVAPSTICRWERGERVPRGDLGLKYLALLQQVNGSGE